MEFLGPQLSNTNKKLQSNLTFYNNSFQHRDQIVLARAKCNAYPLLCPRKGHFHGDDT